MARTIGGRGVLTEFVVGKTVGDHLVDVDGNRRIILNGCNRRKRVCVDLCGLVSGLQAGKDIDMLALCGMSPQSQKAIGRRPAT